MQVLLTLLLLLQPQNVTSDNGIVTGVLRTASGKPVVGVRVTAMAPPGVAEDASKGAAMVSIAETDKDGRYRLENIPPGRYYISAGRLNAPTYFPGTLELSSGRVVALSPSSAVTDVDFVLKDESAGRAVLSGLTFFLPMVPGLTIPVSVGMEGAGKVPIFSNGSYPTVRLTEVSNGLSHDAAFSGSNILLSIPSGTSVDEYTVSVVDLPEGYSVRSIKFDSVDIQKERLKLSSSALTIGQRVLTSVSGPSALSPTPLSVVLAGAPAQSGTGGVRVSGRSVGASSEIYLSEAPGILYEDGTFEFRNVPPGVHTIVKAFGASLAVAPILVGTRDMDGVRLQNTSVVPLDVFAEKSLAPGTKIPEVGPLELVAIHGRIVDEASKEPLSGGVVTVNGYGNSRHDYAIVGDGSFEVPYLSPGVYKLTVHVAGYSSKSQNVAVGLEDLQLDMTAPREAP